ncbi:hypothetical protein [Nesterenkonia flava]|uniref:Permease n=1 Tax=Nesterenkonia flava TaxID=469799 RepID=A0ABU1FU22_9MICC|nr:hypothetical protein [Nesterenkonia flava]MDR5712154.1 hypothetical protein [Nesterenkonia flava]
MKYFPVALMALAAPLLIAALSWAGTAALTVAVCALCVVVAVGWPQLMGVTARKSLSMVILAAGVIAAVGAALVAKTENLFFWSSVALAFGVMTVFVIQVLRGTGRPHRLESTLGACTGVVITTTAAGWVAGLRYPAELAGTNGGDVLGLLHVRGLLHYEDWTVLNVTGPGGELSVVALAASALFAGSLVACLPLREAIVLPATVVVSTAAALTIAILWGELTLLFAGVLGVAAGVLLACFRRFLVQHGAPGSVLSGMAVGAAPVASMGALVYFTERLLFV